MTGLTIYRTPIHEDWIDYNRHLRDAYYGLIVSLATDALMDHIGIDESYRDRTRNTLFTLEMHIHFLQEVHQSDIVDVSVRILGSDAKRIHAAFDLRREGHPEVACTAEIMLLHVHQGEKPAALPFPPEVATAIAELSRAAPPADGETPGSRRMELRGRK